MTLPFPDYAVAIWLATGALTTALLAIAWIDLRSFRIPDAISLPLIGTGLALAALAPGWGHHLIGAVVGFVLLAGIGEVYYRRTGREGLGLGDAKLFAAAGAWLGWQALPQVLLVASITGLIFVLTRQWMGANGKTGGAIAFGPWLSLGFWGAWVAQVWMALTGH